MLGELGFANIDLLPKALAPNSILPLKNPMILFSLDKKSSSLKEFLKSEYIGINILKHNQKKMNF